MDGGNRRKSSCSTRNKQRALIRTTASVRASQHYAKACAVLCPAAATDHSAWRLLRLYHAVLCGEHTPAACQPSGYAPGKIGNTNVVNTVLLSGSHDGTARIFSLDGFVHTAGADICAVSDAERRPQVEALGEGAALGTLGDDVAVAKTLAELHDDSSEW